jgi:large subunit ribosomal protein L15
MFANRLATKYEIVKILGRGELTSKLSNRSQIYYCKAIEAAGGEAVIIIFSINMI